MWKYATAAALITLGLSSGDAWALADVCNRTLTVYDGSTPYKAVYCSQADITKFNQSIKEVHFHVHGVGRDPSATSDNVMDNQRAAGNYGTIVSVHPQFLKTTEHEGQPFVNEEGDAVGGTLALGSTHNDYLYENDGKWDSGAWMLVNSASPTTTGVSAFEVIDAMMQQAVNSYPNLQRIVFEGHSAGGQMAARYAYMAEMPKWRGVTWPVDRFVVMPANPSNFTYLSDERPEQTAAPNHDIAGIPSFVNGFSPSDAAGWCDYSGDTGNYSDSDDYETQLADAGSDVIADCNEAPYVCTLPYSTAVERLKTRRMVQLQGTADDSLTLSGISQSCPSHMQGGTRLDRGSAYYVHFGRQAGFDKLANGTHDIIYAPGIAHSHSGMLTDPCIQWALYGINADSCDPKYRRAFDDDFDNGLLSQWTQSGTGTFAVNRDNRSAGSYSAASIGAATGLTLTSPSISASGVYLLTWAWFLGSRMDAGDYISIEVNEDAGGWVELDRLTGDTDTENTWLYGDQMYSLSSSFQVRFIVNADGAGEDAFVDQVSFQKLEGF